VSAVPAGKSAWLTPDWDAPAGVAALVTTRAGGVSAAPYASCNLGTHVGDDPAAVHANRAALRALLPSDPCWLEQVHGVAVAELTEPAALDAVPPRADAAFTRARGVVCAVLTADCMPVVLAAIDGSVVGVAHAGWRGLANGVIEACVAAMGARELVAYLGPTISGPAYEVGPEVRAAFAARSPAAASAFTANAAGRFQCDLYALARDRLAALGVQRIAGGAFCTAREPARFFSYRRDGRTGRMAALVWRV
jgi:polyphenol oxidase